MNYKKIIASHEYDFLRQNEHLKDSLVLLGLSGSHAYGTNVEDSDFNIRGIALNSEREILLGNDFNQVIDNQTDTTIYSFKKTIELLSDCNPNAIELLGLRPEHYLYLSKEGEQLLSNKDMFLSQRVVKSFSGYINQYLYFLENGVEEESNAVRHILKNGLKGKMNTINHMLCTLNEKITKNLMHIVRLHYMCFDILEKGEIYTYRKAEHDLLLSIRDGEFLNKDNEPTSEFFKLIDTLQKKLQYDKKNTSLPMNPNMKRIEDFVTDIHFKFLINKNKYTL